jgi:hypothetical protein
MTALYGPAKVYNGYFATINFLPSRDYQVTLWEFGRAIRYTSHQCLCAAIAEITASGAIKANTATRSMFEQDVIDAGE